MAAFLKKPIPNWKLERTNDAKTFESRTQLVTGKQLAVIAWAGVACLAMAGFQIIMSGRQNYFLAALGIIFLLLPYLYAKSAQAMRNKQDGIKQE